MPQNLLADSNRASLREIVEANDDWGQTPGTGLVRALRFTSSSISVEKETVVSDEIRDDRMVSSIVEVSAKSGGEINFEFSAGNQDTALQRVLMGAWSRPMTFDVFRGQHVSILANNQISIAGDDVSAYFTVGRRIKLSGFVKQQNNDYVEILTAVFGSGTTIITITTATLAIEGGTALTTVQDANDVIVRKSSALRFGTLGARTIDGNGSNPFAAVIAAGQLVSGQRIFVEGVGYEKGALALDTVLAEDEVTVTDGVNSYTFVATDDTDAAADSDVLFDLGADDAAAAVNLASKINHLRTIGLFAVAATAVADAVNLVNLNKVGGDITDESATITVTSFIGGNEGVGGFYKVITATNDVITVERDVPTIATTTNVTIKACMIRNPTKSNLITPQSATVETGFNDVSQFFTANGLRTGAYSLEVSAGALITGSLTLSGRETKRRNTTLLGGAGYTLLEAAATENVSATANVGALEADGIELATALQSISIELDGNLREQMAVGSKFPVGISAGRLNLTGTITAYFADGYMFDRFLNHTTASLSFPIIDQDKNTYYFTVPSFKITSDPVAPGGIDQDVMETLEFTAFRDAATKCMMQVDRFSSVLPITAL